MAIQGQQMIDANNANDADNTNDTDTEQQAKGQQSKTSEKNTNRHISKRTAQQQQLMADDERLMDAGIDNASFRGNTLMPEPGETAEEYTERFEKFKQAVGQKYGNRQIHSYLSDEGFKNARYSTNILQKMGNDVSELPALTDAQAKALKTPLPEPDFSDIEQLPEDGDFVF